MTLLNAITIILTIGLMCYGGYHLYQLNIEFWNEHYSKRARQRKFGELKRLRKEFSNLSKKEFREAVRSYF